MCNIKIKRGISLYPTHRQHTISFANPTVEMVHPEMRTMLGIQKKTNTAFNILNRENANRNMGMGWEFIPLSGLSPTDRTHNERVRDTLS